MDAAPSARTPSSEPRSSRGPRPARTFAGFLVRHYVEVLTALVVLFILQGSLIPLDFTTTPSARGSRVFFDDEVFAFTLPDIVSNIFLYVPLGVLVHWLVSRSVNSRFSSLMLTLAAAGLLSGALEYAQAYSPTRVSSFIDLISNIVGAGVGASLSWVGRLLIPRLLGAALYELHERPRVAIVKAYALILLVFAALPFSFSIDPGRLKQAVRATNLIPFAATDPVWPEMAGPAHHTSFRGNAYRRWHDARRWARWGVEAASFILLAVLLQPLLRDDYGFSRGWSVGLTVWIGGGLAIGFSAMQVLIVSRACDVTDVLFRFAGIALGLGAHALHRRAFDGLGDAERRERWDRRLRWAGRLTLAYIIYTGVIPFAYAWEPGGAAASLSSRAFLPFFAYFVARFDVMMADVMEKFASFALFAGLLSMTWRSAARASMGGRIVRVCGACVLVSTLIEAIQLMNPVRVTSLTDPILAACAGGIGVVAQVRLVAFYRYAITHDAYGPGKPMPKSLSPMTAPSARLLTLSDTIIGSLAEPYDGAPNEPDPPKRRKHGG